MFSPEKLPRVGIAIVLGLFVLSFGFDMSQNPEHYEDRWAEDVTRSYGNTLMGASVLCVALYLYRLSIQEDDEEEVPERTPVLVTEVEAPKRGPQVDLHRPITPEPIVSDKVAILIGITGGVPAKVEVPMGHFVIGRSPNCEMVLSSQLVSRKHVRLDWDGQTLKLTDLGSSNATLVNDEEIQGDRTLEDGDIVQIVDYQMEVSLSSPESLDATIIRTKDS